MVYGGCCWRSWQVAGKSWHAKCDTWHMTHDMTYDTWLIFPLFSVIFLFVCFGMDATIRIGREIQCLPYAVFFFFFSQLYTIFFFFFLAFFSSPWSPSPSHHGIVESSELLRQVYYFINLLLVQNISFTATSSPAIVGVYCALITTLCKSAECELFNCGITTPSVTPATKVQIMMKQNN